MKKNLVPLIALAIPTTLLLTGCDVSQLTEDKYEQSASKTAKTSAEGVASGLLPSWAPNGGTDVRLEQRSTGHERIFTMDYSGELPSGKCEPLANTGVPSAKELEKGYAADSRTKDMAPEDFVTYRTLEADWWPAGAELQSTALCGRWWVHQDAGKLYAFAPDVASVAEAIVKERAEAE
ncbi:MULTISPECIES: hypothetical protein [unclassified Glutamicibacter]|uniref:hypothetical protein n=1 Tax=Glutamicibacter TaxID=1742989 RepID=UPI000BB9A5FC|nr:MULTISPECIES: hypothetical protein [unclassified Glutamicibacter]PCC30442.1 hypothetical protein CIK76_00080 [Glutamicibacter sp. BW80]PCC31729.1 hypothetical protein CIK74_16710 [Glutamicibacter sp. BW77]